ncbi:S8 family serine peptidase, partial [Chengkuizengella marina]
HGTHVAGTIAALNNNEGVVGVAPKGNLYAVKVLNEDGNGSYAQVIEGIQWAMDNKIDIISMSFGAEIYSQALHEIIKEAVDQGILVIAAAGNGGEGEQTIVYPALFPEVISVGSVDETLVRADYSSTGLALDLVAPGTSILSTLEDEEYGEMSGTSMAVPHVTGAAALIWGSDKKLTANEVKNKLYETATSLGEAHEYGFGLTNVAGALELVEDSEQVDTDQPSEQESENEETIEEEGIEEELESEETEEVPEVIDPGNENGLSQETAFSFDVNEKLTGEMGDTGYIWYKTELVAGQSYQFESDNNIELVLTTEESENIPSFTLNYIPAKTEIYYLKISGIAGNSFYLNTIVPNIDSQGIPPKERKELPQLEGDLLLIAAYFDPDFFDQLNKEEKSELFHLETELINEKIAALNEEDYKTLEELLPVAITQYQYHTNPEAYMKELQKDQPEQSDVNPLQDSEKLLSKTAVVDYTFTEFNNEYTYDIKSNQFVDPLYRTANRSATDIYLPGKNGFDIVLTRQYNSLDSKIMQPEANRSSNYANEIDPEDVKNGFIATGWSLNLPYLEMDLDINGKIVHDINYLGEDSSDEDVYVNNYIFDEDEPSMKFVFTVENGSSYEFRLTDINGSPKMELVNHPYVNEVSLEVRANGFRQHFNFENGPDQYNDNMLGFDIETFTLGVGNTLYDFDDQGRIIQKYSHINNMIVDYEYVNNDIIITDTLGRIITIYRNDDLVISRIKAMDSTGNTIQEVNYDTSYRSQNITYKYSSDSNIIDRNVSFWRLNAVKDESHNVLESYDYYTVDSTTLADFNLLLEPYTHYTRDDDGRRIRDEDDYDDPNTYLEKWISDDDSTFFEVFDIYDKQIDKYAEIPYLLLKNITFNNGTQLKFNYDQYNPRWFDYDGINEMGMAVEERNSTRLFLDRYALQHMSYLAVNRIDFNYEDAVNPSSMNYIEYENLHRDHGWNFKEYWKNEKSKIPRLRSSSRFGDRQTIKETTSSGKETYYHYVNNGSTFLLNYTWINDSKESEFQFVEDGQTYLSQSSVVTEYSYLRDATKPRSIYQYTDEIPSYWERVEEDGYNDALLIKNEQFPLINSLDTINKLVSRYEYDSYGKVVQEVDPLGNVTTYEYDDANFHQLSNVTLYSADGLTTYQKELFYDDYMPDFTTETYTYQDPFSSSNKLDVFKTDVQYINELLTSLDIYASGDQFGTEKIVTEKDFTYTDDAKLKTETTKVTLEEGQSPTSLTIQYDYNTDGTIKEIIYPDTSEVEYDYDYLDRIKTYRQVPFGGDIRTTTVDYVNDERKVTVNTPDGEQIESFYTPFGLNVKQVRNVNGISKVINEIESSDGIITDATKPYGNSELGT